MHPRAEEDAFLFTFINYFLRITKDQREKAAAFTRAIVTRPSVKSKSVASCSGYEIVLTCHYPLEKMKLLELTYPNVKGKDMRRRRIFVQKQLKNYQK